MGTDLGEKQFELMSYFQKLPIPMTVGLLRNWLPLTTVKPLAIWCTRAYTHQHVISVFTEILSLSFLHRFPLFSVQITVLFRAQRGIHFSALPWQSSKEGVFSLTGAVTLINDHLVAACLQGNTVHTLCLSLTHIHTHHWLFLPQWLAVQLTHTLRSLYMLIGRQAL